MKYPALFLFLILAYLPLFAQPVDGSTSAIFAFIEQPNGKQNTPGYLENQVYLSTSAYQKAKQIFDQLVEARGDFRMRVPTFVFSDAERRVAVAKPRKAEIVLEKKAYEVCRSLGKDSLNAIAALLSHELIHYYEKHDWTNHFARLHGQTNTAAQLQNLDEGLKLETQADYLGGFLAYSAGYQTLEIMPRLLDAIYESYGLTEQISGYPSLQERKAIAKQSLAKLKQMIYVFDTANYLTGIEHYEAAKTYLDFILKDFQSRELYNNLGVISTLTALKHLDVVDTQWAFPIELDAQSRLAKKSKGTGAQQEKAQDLLNQAILYFEQANQLDRSYPLALLNLACVYTLLKKYDDADFYLRKAQQLSNRAAEDKVILDILVLKGIIEAVQQEQKKALEYFQQAQQSGSGIAQINLHILDPSTVDEQVDYPRGFAKKEPFKTYKLDKTVASFLMGKLKMEETIKINKQSKCGVEERTRNTLYGHLNHEQSYAFFLLLNPIEATEAYQIIPQGTSYDQIIQEYGRQADRRIKISGGSMLVYYKEQVFFKMNQQDQLEQIGLFRFRNEG